MRLVDLKYLAVIRDGFFLCRPCSRRRGPVEVGVGIIRVELYGLGIVGGGAVDLDLSGVSEAPVGRSGGILRIERDGFGIVCDGTAELASVDVDGAPPVASVTSTRSRPAFAPWCDGSISSALR